jgi:hypothetical protein
MASSTEINTSRTASRSDEFLERVRTALRPLLADEALREKTALKIQEQVQRFIHRQERERPESFNSPRFLDFAGKVNRAPSQNSLNIVVNAT